jgi:hypothetical protein
MLAGIALTIALVALVLTVIQRRALHEQQRRLDELQQRLVLQQQSISGLTAGALGMDKRLRRTEASERLIIDRQEVIESQQAAEQPYSHAIRLVQQGASARRLMEELSLSESEADLLVRLHGLRDTA